MKIKINKLEYQLGQMIAAAKAYKLKPTRWTSFRNSVGKSCDISMRDHVNPCEHLVFHTISSCCAMGAAIIAGISSEVPFGVIAGNDDQSDGTWILREQLKGYNLGSAWWDAMKDD